MLGAVLAGVVIGEALGSAVGRLLARQLGRGVLSSVDRFAGGFLGAAQAILIMWLAGGLLAAGPFPTLGRAATQSAVVRGVDQFLPPPTEVVGEIAGALDASGLPDVFVGLDPIPLPAVDTPSDPQAARIAKAATAAAPRASRPVRATPRSTARPCVVAPGYLVTNAHVVAGASTVRAALGSSVADAVPVLFDPDLDVAVLYAPDLAGAVAALRDDGPGAGRRGCGARVRRAAGRSSCCRPRSRARTRPPATTSTTPA